MHLAESQEIINQLLRRISFRAEVFYRGQLCDSWALDTSGSGNVNFHLICHGNCWLHMPNVKEARFLQSGDVLVFPHDATHVISASNEPPLSFGIQQIPTQVALNKTTEGTALICGYLIIDRLVRNLLLNGAPDFLILSSTQAQGSIAQINTLLDLLFTEASMNILGTSAILDRLADALLFYVMRDLVEKDLFVKGLLGVLGDEKICRAVHEFTLAPGNDWSLDTLAAKAFLSRSVFAERFLSACGMPPMEFVTLWRMYLARRWLEQEAISVVAIAERCGYQSTAAFSKAFKRTIGVGPGQIRKITSKGKIG